jgi:hypothetical protein
MRIPFVQEDQMKKKAKVKKEPKPKKPSVKEQLSNALKELGAVRLVLEPQSPMAAYLDMMIVSRSLAERARDLKEGKRVLELELKHAQARLVDYAAGAAREVGAVMRLAQIQTGNFEPNYDALRTVHTTEANLPPVEEKEEE